MARKGEEEGRFLYLLFRIPLPEEFVLFVDYSPEGRQKGCKCLKTMVGEDEHRNRPEEKTIRCQYSVGQRSVLAEFVTQRRGIRHRMMESIQSVISFIVSPCKSFHCHSPLSI